MCDNVTVDNYYEVFKYHVGHNDIFHDDDWEIYPSDEHFGYWAWCCSDLNSVRKVLTNHFQNVDGDEIIRKLHIGTAQESIIS